MLWFYASVERVMSLEVLEGYVTPRAPDGIALPGDVQKGSQSAVMHFIRKGNMDYPETNETYTKN